MMEMGSTDLADVVDALASALKGPVARARWDRWYEAPESRAPVWWQAATLEVDRSIVDQHSGCEVQGRVVLPDGIVRVLIALKPDTAAGGHLASLSISVDPDTGVAHVAEHTLPKLSLSGDWTEPIADFADQVIARIGAMVDPATIDDQPATLRERVEHWIEVDAQRAAIARDPLMAVPQAYRHLVAHARECIVERLAFFGDLIVISPNHWMLSGPGIAAGGIFRHPNGKILGDVAIGVSLWMLASHPLAHAKIHVEIDDPKLARGLLTDAAPLVQLDNSVDPVADVRNLSYAAAETFVDLVSQPLEFRAKALVFLEAHERRFAARGGLGPVVSEIAKKAESRS
jgi:hypothetical protein